MVDALLATDSCPADPATPTGCGCVAWRARAHACARPSSATSMAHRGETQKQTSRSNDTYCVNKPTETSCVCFSVLSRSKLQMVATSAARRRDKNDLCLTCVGVVDVATRCSFVATQLVATRCSFVSLRCSFVSFRVRSLGVAAHVACSSKQGAVTKQQLLQLEETSGDPATRELNLVGQNPSFP